MSILVDINHEAGNLNEWSSITGSPSATSGAALATSDYGMNTPLGSDNYGAFTFTDNTTGIFRCRFYFNLNSFTMTTGQTFYFMAALANGTNFARVRIYYNGGTDWVLQIQAVNDAGGTNSVSHTIDYNTAYYLEFEITRASSSSASDGTNYAWLNGTSIGTPVTNIDNYDRFNLVDEVRLGSLHSWSNPTISGTIYLDEIIANDDGSEIGAWSAASNTYSSKPAYLEGGTSYLRGSNSAFAEGYIEPTTYYVDATGGLDTNDGKSESGAWQTLTKVNAETYNEGDTILFKRGETFTGTLIPSSSGVTGHYITYGVYGTGNMPVIDAENAQTRALSIENAAQSYLEFNDIHFTRATSQAAYIDTPYINFNRCYFTNSGGGLVIYGNNNSGVNLHHINVTDCQSYGNAGQGVLCTPYPNGLYGPHDILFKDCIAHDNGSTDYADHGFYVSFGTTLDGCISYDNHYAGIKVNCEGYHDSPYSPVVKNCTCYGNEAGLYVGNIDSLFFNNLVYNNGENVTMDGDARNCEFYFNTFVNAVDLVLTTYNCINVASLNATGNIFKNNLFIQDSAVDSRTTWGVNGDTLAGFASRFELDYNIYYRAGGGGTETVVYAGASYSFNDLQTAGEETNSTILTALPQFLARYTNLHVIEGGNLDVDGTAITGITTDLDGVTRGSPPNVGAYEPTRIGDTQSAYLEGESAATGVSDNQLAFLKGSTNALDSVSVYLFGIGVADDSIPTFIDVTGQALVPDGDIVDGNWVNESSGTNLYPSLADDNDSTYVWIDGGVQNDTFTVQLSNPDGVPASGPHYLMWKIYNKGGSGTITLKLELFCGSTLVKSDTQTVPSGAQEFIIKLDEADILNISDYTNLTAKVTIEGVA